MLEQEMGVIREKDTLTALAGAGWAGVIISGSTDEPVAAWQVFYLLVGAGLFLALKAGGHWMRMLIGMWIAELSARRALARDYHKDAAPPWGVHKLCQMIGPAGNDTLQGRAVPEPYAGRRLLKAWWVLTGRAEAVVWPKPGELERAIGSPF